MIKKLILRNFRKHEDLTLDFAHGLTVMRAPNEGGKSTIIEAMLYALYGSRALRSSIEDVVTWGHNPNTLKVVLHFGDYVFSRSTKGAEVTKDGMVFVTGQTEVSNFATSLMGADVNLASRLMLASQNNLRGSLDAGPKATSLLIESLASFDLFDTLIERMQARLLLGSPSSLESNLEQAQQQLDAVVPPPPVDQDTYIMRRRKIEEGLNTCQVTVETAESALKDAENNHQEAKTAREASSRTRGDLAALEKAIGVRQGDLSIAAQVTGPTEEALEEAAQALTKAQAALASQAHWEAFAAYKEPGLVWDDTPEALNDYRRLAMEGRSKVDATLARLEAEIKAEKAEINTETTCKLCGQDIAHLHNREATNEALLASIAKKESEWKDAKVVQVQLNTELSSYDQIAKADAKASELVRKIGTACITVDYCQVPPKLTWRGAAPGYADCQADVTAAQDSLQKLQRQKKEAEAAQARHDMLGAQLGQDVISLAALKTKLATFEDVSEDVVEELWKEVLRLRFVISCANSTKALGESELVKLDLEHDAAVKQAAAFEQQRQFWIDQVERTKGDLTKLTFNNNLLKKIRAARPKIADKLWGTVLAAVSTIFSTMRGTASVVTKGGEGFTVNGQAIASLSGSTLDILGLAIRVALVRTFLPTCQFLVLDEPAQGCDEARTAAMLGFIASCQFHQVLLITHENISESSANNLITL
jgi:DNA repair exonuclease SbcCD ATPase subunit